jgi:hypothetical protein
MMAAGKEMIPYYLRLLPVSAVTRAIPINRTSAAIRRIRRMKDTHESPRANSCHTPPFERVP